MEEKGKRENILYDKILVTNNVIAHFSKGIVKW
jgi:hypothetical protein